MVGVSGQHRHLTLNPSAGRRATRSVASLVGGSRLALLAGVAALVAACGSGGTSTGSGGDVSVAGRQETTGRAGSVGARPQAPPTHTSCHSVVYIGDSTSDGEVRADYVSNARLRLPAQLKKVGVTKTLPEVSGARSIVETWHGLPNAATVAKQDISQGFRGCWILALGTNEAADVEAGSNVGPAARIARMMAILGDQPVMWVNAITLEHSSAYTERAMQRWNKDLLGACRQHPQMRVFDWAAHAKPRWFIPDGIHYTSAGYVIRTRLIARALVKAFPRNLAPSESCLVR
jgi:hypothetical protein